MSRLLTAMQLRYVEGGTNYDGSHPRRLTSHPAFDSAPTWSPDGKRILFESQRDGRHQLYTVGLSGRPAKRLLVSDAEDTRPAQQPRRDAYPQS